MSAAADAVTIIGAGWAGLSAAIELCEAGYKIRLIDAAPNVGGRAQSRQDEDNGQHLLIGAYQNCLGMMRKTGIEPSTVFDRQPLSLSMINPDTRAEDFCLPPSALPAPLHLVSSLLRAQGLPWRDKLTSLIHIHRLLKQSITPDISVADACQSVPAGVRHNMLYPLCLAALNTPAERASFAVFQQVLQRTFNTGKAASDFLIAKRPLQAVFPGPALQWLQQHGGEIVLRCKVEQLQWREQQGHYEIVSPEGAWHSQRVILATPPAVSERVLRKSQFPDSQTAAQLATQLSHIRPSPVTTLYLRYSAEKTAALPAMQGLLTGPAEWLFNLNHYKPGWLSAVISGHSSWIRNRRLNQAVTEQVQQLFPQLGQPSDIIRRSIAHACFDCCVNINHYRPQNRTPFGGLYLAGDYTDTGLPATLESAVTSGRQAATQLMQDMP